MLVNCKFYWPGVDGPIVEDEVNITNFGIGKIVQMPTGDHDILSVVRFEDSYHILLSCDDEQRSA